MTNWRRLCVVAACWLMSGATLGAQQSWDVRDPLDLGPVDLGDNKVLLYNAIGVGLSLWLSNDNESADPSVVRPYSISSQYWKEYKREPLSEYLKLAVLRRYRVRDYLYIGPEAHLSYVTDTDVSTIGTGFSAVFEWHLLRNKNLRLIFNNGVGPNFFLQPFPFGGTRFNFTTHYGIKLEIRVADTWTHLSLYNLHISNAEIKGRERNPPMDAIGFSAGLSF